MMNLPFELAERELSPLLWAHARVLFDPLTKTEGLNEREKSLKGTVTEGVIRWFRTARTASRWCRRTSCRRRPRWPAWPARRPRA
jgi:putative cardiolipin synthase